MSRIQLPQVTLMAIFVFIISCGAPEPAFNLAVEVPEAQRQVLSASSSDEIGQKKNVLTLNVRALKKLQFDINKNYESYQVAGLKSNHDKLDISSSHIEFTAEISDIGDTATGSLQLESAEEILDLAVNVKIENPKIKKQSCHARPNPVIGSIDPIEKWHSPSFNDSDGKRYYLTYSSPVVGDIDNDGIVEVIGIYSTSAYSNSGASIVVINGKTGVEEWNSVLSSTGITGESSTTPAIADIDNDGKAEIIVTDVYKNSSGALKRRILAIDYDGGTATVKFSYEDQYKCGSKCMPSVADLDGDGTPEIVAGNVVLDAAGNRKFFLDKHSSNGAYLIPVLANLTKSPGLEIIQGDTVYSSTGALIHKVVGCSRFSAVADLDDDADMEHVCIGDGQVYAYDHLGAKLWQKAIPAPSDATRTGGGGAPNIGDFNGDGKLEIGTAGGYYYVVFNYLGEEVWKTVTQDTSSLITGSTIFDFNGDGKVEVVYNDERKLRIYDGAAGTVIWETNNPSGTLTEYPIIANIDDTPSVEIITSAPSLGGIRAFKDPSNLWVGSRKLWNQYAYYPSIVDDKLKVTSDPNVIAGFRVNTQGINKSGEKILLPDVSVYPAQTLSRKTKSLKFFVFNQGEAAAQGFDFELIQGGVSISKKFYKTNIKPGEGELIEFSSESFNPEVALQFSLNMDSQDVYIYKECKVDNNSGSVKLELAR